MTLRSASRDRYSISCEDVRSHFVKLGRRKVVLLAGYDLGIFNSGVTKRAEHSNLCKIDAFHKILEIGRPDTVLHLDEKTYSSTGNQRAWNHMLKKHYSIKHFAGTYETWSLHPETCPRAFSSVLELTAGNDVLNIFINILEDPEPCISVNKSRLKLKRKRQKSCYPKNINKINLIGICCTGTDFMIYAQTIYSKAYSGVFISTTNIFFLSDTPPFYDFLPVGEDHSPLAYQCIKDDIEDSLDEILECLDRKRTNVIIADPGRIYSSIIIKYLARYAKEENIELCAFLVDEVTDPSMPAIEGQAEQTARHLYYNDIVYFQYSFEQF